MTTQSTPRGEAQATKPRAKRAAAVRPGARILPGHARSHNRALVLQSLYRTSGLSRADVAREVGLTRVTISDLVADLIDEGLVIELGVRSDARPGKPATVLDINRSGFTIVGVDLSYDAMFLGALMDLDGTVLHREQVESRGLTGEAGVEAIRGLLDRLLAQATTPVLGIGVGSPGVVDAEGTILSAPNFGWSGLPLQALLAEHTGLPVQVANDANVAALAERTFGEGQDDMMLIRVGRGLGSGLVVGGMPVQGARSAAGEIGHVVVGTDGGQRCACGKDGCLETWLAIPRLEARLATEGADRDAVLAESGERLGIAIAPIVGALNLAEVILSGPSELLGGTLLESTAETLRSRTMADFHGNLALRMTTLGRDIIVLGAAVMVLTGQLGVS
jgi:predicted NBD/HSP70 family sugar kinase